MPIKRKTPSQKSADGPCSEASKQADAPDSQGPFGPDLMHRMHEVSAQGLTPSRALELLSLLIPAVASASKEDIDRFKMLDKFMNTARAIMETRLKTEEALLIAAKLDEMESRLENLMALKRVPDPKPVEVWNNGNVACGPRAATFEDPA
jgi:hypothetical protein